MKDVHKVMRDMLYILNYVLFFCLLENHQIYPYFVKTINSHVILLFICFITLIYRCLRNCCKLSGDPSVCLLIIILWNMVHWREVRIHLLGSIILCCEGLLLMFSVFGICLLSLGLCRKSFAILHLLVFSCQFLLYFCDLK